MKKEKIKKLCKQVGGVLYIVGLIILTVCSVLLMLSGEEVYGSLMFCFVLLTLAADYLLNIKKSVDLLHCMVMTLLIEKYEGYEIKVTRKDKSVVIVRKNQTIKSE